MAVEHRNLTGADLHEPKGIEGAGSGQVYVADGLGSGSWQAQSGGSGGSANIDDAIVNGTTDRAPSQNAVYDALQLKADTDLGNVTDADFANKAASAGVGGGGAGVADAINDGVTTIAPSQNAVYDALQLKADTDLSNVSGANFLSKAGSAGVVEDIITNGVSNKAPSQNAVFDALALKSDTSHTHAQSDITGLSTALSGKADTNLSNVSNSDFATKAAAAGVGGSGSSFPVVDAVTTSRYFFPRGYSRNASSAATVGANQIMYMPCWITLPECVAITYEVTSIGANLRIGLYDSDATTNRPGSLIEDLGTQSVATTGIKSAGFASPRDLDGLYWVAFLPSSSTGLRASTETPGILGSILGYSAFNATASEAYCNSSYAYGALPSTASWSGYANTLVSFALRRD